MSGSNPQGPFLPAGSYVHPPPVRPYQPAYPPPPPPPTQPQQPYLPMQTGYGGGAYALPPPSSLPRSHLGVRQPYGLPPPSPARAPAPYDNHYDNHTGSPTLPSQIPFGIGGGSLSPGTPAHVGHHPAPGAVLSSSHGRHPLPPPPPSAASASPVLPEASRPRVAGQPLPEKVVDAAMEEATEHWQRRPSMGEGHPPEDLLGGDVDGGGVGARARAMGEAEARQFRLPKAPPRDIQFVVGSPRYRLRTTLLFASALFGVIPLMSSFAFTVLLCGVVVVYIADYLGSISGTLFALVGTAAMFAAALFLSNLHAAATSFGPMLMIADLAAVTLMATAACLLHFRWFQETRPEVVCLLERCVIGLTPILALPSILTTTIALTGSRYGPFFFLAAMCVLHYSFYCPMKSSFMAVAVGRRELKYFVPRPRPEEAEGRGGRGSLKRGPVPQDDVPTNMGDDDESRAALVPQQLNERVEAVVFTILLLTLPLVLYNTIQTNWWSSIVGNLLNSVGLLCGAMTYICVTPVESLWFLAPPKEDFLRALDAGRTAPPPLTTGDATQPAGVNPETIALLLAYDPLGLRVLIATYRTRALLGVCALGINWAAYRLTHSRYAYLFDGVPYPYNFACLMVALGVTALLAVEIFVLVSADEAGRDVTKGQYVARRASVALGSIVVVVLFCALSASPGVFYFLGVLSITSLNVFLVDRTNVGPMVSFIVFSSLLLLWWLFRTFSFVVVDMKVLNGQGSVSSSLVAVSVLWSYILGTLVFLLSFSKSKLALVIMVFMHAAELTFVEEVLIAQKDEGAYPAVLVFLTSGIGALVGYRFYRNEVLGIQGAAFVASCYLAKILSLLVQRTSAYYGDEDASAFGEVTKGMLAMELSCSWWAGLIVCYVITLFEIEQRKRLAAREAARLPYLYLAGCVVVTLCTLRNVQRAVYEFLTQSFVAPGEVPHIVLGTGCLTFALLIGPFFAQQSAERYPSLRRFATMGKLSGALGILLLAVQPTRIVDTQVSGLDYEMVGADKGRYASALGLFMLMGVRFVPLRLLPAGARALYWLATATLLAFGITAQLLPMPTFPLFGCMVGFVFLMLLVVDVAHYRELTSVEGWVVYGLSFCVMVGSFVFIGRIDLREAAMDNVALMLEMHEQGRMRLLSIIAVVNLFVAVLLKCRFAGRPLLPRCVPMTATIASQVGVMGNFATLFSTFTLGLLNAWGKQGDPWMYALLSLFLLLLVDDDVLYFDLARGDFRYFPCLCFAFVSLWLCQLGQGWALGGGRSFALRVFLVGRAAVEGLLLLPCQGYLLKDLWSSAGASEGKATAAAAAASRGRSKVMVVSLIVSGLVLVFAPSSTVACMALVCVCGHCVRIYGSGLARGPARRRRLGGGTAGR